GHGGRQPPRGRGARAKGPAAERLRRLDRRAARAAGAGGRGGAPEPVPLRPRGGPPAPDRARGRGAREDAMTPRTLEDYRAVAPAGTVDFLRRLSERVRNRRLLNVSASREVGGVAETLRGLVPLLVEARPQEGAWVWRCHLDVSRPQRRAWTFLRQYVVKYDAAVFSLPAFAQRLPIPQFMIYPAIDPLSDKSRELAPVEVAAICDRLRVPRDKPILLQVGRFDRFKDPLGVIEAYRLVKRQHDCRLVLVGGAESDDPEGVELSAEVREAASHDPDLHVLELPGERVEVNALQRAATIVLQKSTREGFGLG